MERLTAMESKQEEVAQKLVQQQSQILQSQTQPSFRPAYLTQMTPMVQQPGTITQAQWASPNQYTQSQC